MKRSLLVLLFAVMAFPACAQTPAYSDNILAVVNEEVITLYDVASYTYPVEIDMRKQFDLSRPATPAEMERYKSESALYAEELTKLRRNGAQRLIDVEVMYAEFVRQGYQVPPDALDRRIDQLVQGHETSKGDYAKFEEELAKRNLTMNSLREQMYKTIAVEMLERTLVDSRIVVTPAKIERYYQEHPEHFSDPVEVRLSYIAIRQGDLTAPQFTEKMTAISNELRADGSNFDALIAKHSVDPKNAHLGWTKEAQLRDDWKRALPSMTTGSVSSWAVSGKGADRKGFLVRVTEAKNVTMHPLDDDLRKQIRSRIYTEERRRLSSELVAKLRGQAYIRVFFEQNKGDDASSTEG